MPSCVSYSIECDIKFTIYITEKQQNMYIEKYTMIIQEFYIYIILLLNKLNLILLWK